MVPARLGRVLLTGLFLFSGCTTLSSQGILSTAPPPQGVSAGASPPDGASRPAIREPSETDQVTTDASETASTTPPGAESLDPVEGEPAPPWKNNTPDPSRESSGMTDQERIDAALERLEASNNLWEQGDVDTALVVLDEAYSLILGVGCNGNGQIHQQKEDLRLTISKRILETHASRFRAANGLSNVIPLSMNRHVQKALDLFTGRGKEAFLAAYQRSGKYRPAIVEALREAGLPEELSWLPLIESDFKVRAFSKARALGLWQFIASTGYKYGLKRDRWIDERMDPQKSTKAAIAYLKELHHIFGDWATALAAYNCGEYAVLKRIRTQKINYLDNFWDLYERLPSETAFYVPQFLAVLHILNDPKAHGMELPPLEEPAETETVTISRQVHLKAIAKMIDEDEEFLRELNAALRRNVTPDRPYELKVPSGKGDVLLGKLDDIPAWRQPVPAYYVHRVRKGESLSTIAAKYRTSVRAITVANKLKEKDLLQVGARLNVPAEGRGAAALKTTTMQSDGLKGKVITYEVRKGDSLWKIAGQYGTTTGAIKALNQLKSARLRVGQVIKVPGWSQKSKPETTQKVRVKKGDSPYLMAKRYQMDLADFLSLNNLTPRCTIFPGQELLIRSD